jgi:hypothetical protein
MHEDHGSNSRTSQSNFRETGSGALGIARITLLRAREAGRIRFFRIGTCVLYSDQQLADFLSRCEVNGSNRKKHETADPPVPVKQRELWRS